MIWNPNKECMSRDEMHALQSKRLQKLVNYGGWSAENRFFKT